MRALALRSSGTARPGPNTFSRRWLLMAAPAAGGGGRYRGIRAEPRSRTGTRPRPAAVASQEVGLRLNPSATMSSRLRWHTSSDGNMTAKQPGGVARQRGIGVVVVIGGNGSGDLSRRGIARVFLGCAEAAPVRRGHKHPHGKKSGLAKRA